MEGLALVPLFKLEEENLLLLEMRLDFGLGTILMT